MMSAAEYFETQVARVERLENIIRDVKRFYREGELSRMEANTYIRWLRVSQGQAVDQAQAAQRDMQNGHSVQ